MTNHLRWIGSLLLGVASVPVGFVLLIGGSALAGTGPISGLPALVMTNGLWLGLAGPVLFGVLAIVAGMQTYGGWRRSAGRFTKAELAAKAQLEREATVWADAQRLTAALIAGRLPPPLSVPGIVLEPGEQAYFDVTAQYSRYYDYEVGTVQLPSVVPGQPGFLMSTTTVVPRSQRVAPRWSRRGAAVQSTWSPETPARVIVTDKRILCESNGSWASFGYDTITAYYPTPLQWSVEFQLQQAEPVRLAGLAVPAVAAFVAAQLEGAQVLAASAAFEPLRARPAVQDAVVTDRR
jgi:hypothetical protein